MLIFIPGHAGLLPFLIQAFLLCLVVTALPPGDRRNRSPGDVPEQAGRNPQSHEHPAATTAGWTGQYPPFDLTEYDPGVHCPHESSPNGGGATWGLVPTIDAAAELDPTPGQEYPVAVPNYDPLTNTANYMAVPPTGESQGGSSENPQNPQEYFGYQNRNPFAPSYLSSGFLNLPYVHPNPFLGASSSADGLQANNLGMAGQPHSTDWSLDQPYSPSMEVDFLEELSAEPVKHKANYNVQRRLPPKLPDPFAAKNRKIYNQVCQPVVLAAIKWLLATPSPQLDDFVDWLYKPIREPPQVRGGHSVDVPLVIILNIALTEFIKSASVKEQALVLEEAAALDHVVLIENYAKKANSLYEHWWMLTDLRLRTGDVIQDMAAIWLFLNYFVHKGSSYTPRLATIEGSYSRPVRFPELVALEASYRGYLMEALSSGNNPAPSDGELYAMIRRFVAPRRNWDIVANLILDVVQGLATALDPLDDARMELLLTHTAVTSVHRRYKLANKNNTSSVIRHFSFRDYYHPATELQRNMPSVTADLKTAQEKQEHAYRSFSEAAKEFNSVLESWPGSTDKLPIGHISNTDAAAANPHLFHHFTLFEAWNKPALPIDGSLSVECLSGIVEPPFHNILQNFISESLL